MWSDQLADGLAAREFAPGISLLRVPTRHLTIMDDFAKDNF